MRVATASRMSHGSMWRWTLLIHHIIGLLFRRWRGAPKVALNGRPVKPVQNIVWWTRRNNADGIHFLVPRRLSSLGGSPLAGSR